ncbi:PhoH family protein [Paracrocinitomix mangrovi]|uniref:PhoH family protein n=1 Tax=Paracrocinitomix mangrovi TaxID=2862509 RepID=UPI001C8E8933|nr:PhoH family protein [Paracrocinitomix mangrovi]UKN02900.1 PhoH family protein [Paracrocinitomix mangrovi]
MHEKVIEIVGVDPVVMLGINESKLKLYKQYFPKLKFVSRGNLLKILGEAEIVDQFEKKWELMLKHVNRYNSLTENNIENLMLQDSEQIPFKDHGETIVHGNGGLSVKARTANQRKLVKASMENDMVFAIGPAGTGKTYTSVALAVRALKNKEVRRIILTRPAVEAGENLGFLPGDLREKLDPYMAPLYDGLRDMIPAEKLAEYIEHGIIEIAPLAFMRGRTLDNAYVILDEAQNTTTAQMKMFLTRMGQSAKFIITGDATQIDLPRNQKSGLNMAINKLKDIEGIGLVQLDERDVIRHKLVKQIIQALKDDE